MKIRNMLSKELWEWFNVRRQSRITASTMHNALGFRTLKAQKAHYDEFVLGKVPPITQTPLAMLHGTQHEVNSVHLDICVFNLI